MHAVERRLSVSPYKGIGRAEGSQVTPARKIAVVAGAVVGASFVLMALVAWPAGAHGALQNPVSRAAACGPEGGAFLRSGACRAATGAVGATVLSDWDSLRVANVGGRDRQVIPDGKLCSGGLAEFKGLDLPRADWPATTLTAGAVFTFRYRETIPHTGTFKLYVTKPGYDPARPLKWADLEAKPFLKVTDPSMRDGSYILNGRLPAARTGHHLIYTIWQNSSTPDTYYSCSDVIFSKSAATSKKSARPVAASAPLTSSGSKEAAGSGGLPLVAGGAAAVVIIAGAAAALARRGRAGHAGDHRLR
jgi:chitin-binding protein